MTTETDAATDDLAFTMKQSLHLAGWRRAMTVSLSKLIPVSGQLLGAGSRTLLSGAATCAIGKVFIQHFAVGGTFLTFDPEAVRDYLEQQIEAGRQVATELKPRPPRTRRGG